ncbi:type II toxin-antitoxin system HipA family toxin [Clavibacter sp. VKM Ac-2872]|uniref:type II toxin-antitoxin system HipA family toxin n=1 Tax=Clavibacter sp. VKM Ac-2872 TaxID=2783812 RepID=UPI00188B505B|nr:HipA domain-containing protein [Clavibacter sp. VKM Ac-2872]MBF4622679.1 HipA domain-containing protein [Clavibacter sp. VKM Ac-2872]
MADVYEVTTVLGREEVRAGRIYRTRTSGSFEYDSDYLRRRDAFALVPALGLFPGAQSLSPINPFSDSAPDTWGRKVQNRAAGRTLDELTLMFGVNDEGRQGATRFWDGGVAMAPGAGVPVEADLSQIIHVADQIERGETEIDDAAVRRLFRATGSLGGARPKANVRIGTDLWLAKFPKPTGDEWNVMAWEAATLDVMGEVGIDVPQHITKAITVEGTRRTVLFLRRFDRTADGVRVPYISAMTALEATDGDGGDWVDLVDFARVAGADTTELWRRSVFGALIGNLDDHLRNHGFLRRGTAWALAPVFDVNPEPLGNGELHQLALLGDREARLEAFAAEDALDLFGVRPSPARDHLERLRSALPRLPRRASAHGADAFTIETMGSRIDAAVAAVGRVLER